MNEANRWDFASMTRDMVVVLARTTRNEECMKDLIDYSTALESAYNHKLSEIDILDALSENKNLTPDIMWSLVQCDFTSVLKNVLLRRASNTFINKWFKSGPLNRADIVLEILDIKNVPAYALRTLYAYTHGFGWYLEKNQAVYT
jgi:hypothetical protein